MALYLSGLVIFLGGIDMAEYHIHPHPVRIYGEKLVPGDRIREGDVFASTTGSWERAHPYQLGLLIVKECRAYWVRPDYVKK